MPTCFVIQPFDGAKYDKRYRDVFAPAVREAGLDPYRVDEDASVNVPVEAIEAGIRGAALCIADITTDNPNVWYELGYSFASGKQVVMVCSSERDGKKYPFDIQHRTIIPYQPDAPSDFEVLRAKITARISAILNTTDALATIIQAAEQVARMHGLSQMELAVLASMAGNVSSPHDVVSLYSVREQVGHAGFAPAGITLGIRRLQNKEFVTITTAIGGLGDEYQALSLLPAAWDWIEQNEDKFLLRLPEPDLDREMTDTERARADLDRAQQYGPPESDI